MVTEQQFRETLRRWVEALNAKDWDAFDKLMDELYTDDYVGHLPVAQDPVRGPEGMKQYFRNVLESIPGYHAMVEDVLVAGDKGAARFTGRRTDPATGKKQRLTGIMINRFVSGKFAEDWQLVGPWEDEG
jgi:ketosteroid isomerase-like protein